YGRNIPPAERLQEPATMKSMTLQANLQLTQTTNSTIKFTPYQTIKTGSWAEVVTIADIDDDGSNDVIVATSTYSDPQNDNKLHIFKQNSANLLELAERYPTGSRTQSIDAGDLNNDGLTDIAVGNFGSNTLGAFLQNTSGTLDPMAAYATLNGPDGVKIGDLNNDGLMDVAVSHWSADYIGVFNQNQGGTLDALDPYYVTRAGYDEIAIGDVNNDGLKDVIFMRGQGMDAPIVIFHQNAAGTFDAPVSYSANLSFRGGIAVGDVNSDGRDDVVLCGGGNKPSSKLAVFLQNESGSLNSPILYDAYDCPEAVEIADINGDGHNDIVVAHGGWCAVSIYKQNASGSLEPYTTLPVSYASHYQPDGLAVGDFNDDKKPDIALADYNYGLVVLYNTTNYPPALSAIGSKAVDENRTLRFTVDASDPEGDTLTYSASNLPTGATFDPGTRRFSWKPTYQQAGLHTVHFEVTDGSGIASEDVQITVNNVNLIPTANIVSIVQDPVSEEQSIILTGRGEDSDGSIVEYKWRSSIDGDLPGNAETIVVSTLSVGKHTIYLKVKDNDNAWSKEVKKSFTVTPAPAGKISGTVYGRQYLFRFFTRWVPLRGAVVSIRGKNVNILRTVITDFNGKYEAGSLPKGRYSVEGALQGYKTKKRVITLKQDQQKEVDLKLLNER
ncbi:MAG: FG-GAP-like repeat-containing protein, partial [Candidatus Omnitrophica bacterium]|nr:FG-GAP-like repeat-containing protein [Candidatus Omnitrophota bacterium]